MFLNGRPVIIAGDKQAVLQKLLLAVGAGVLQLSVLQDKSFDLVKILIHLLSAQRKEALQDRIGRSGTAAACVSTRFSVQNPVKIRLVIRFGVVETIAFCIQNTAGAFAACDLLIEDLLLVGQGRIIRKDLAKKCGA